MTAEDKQKLNQLKNLPLFQKMIEIGAEKVKNGEEIPDIETLKEDAKISLIQKVEQFRANKVDVNLLSKKIYTQINLKKLAREVRKIQILTDET